MIFSSYTFIFVFLPIVFTVYFMVQKLAGDRPAKACLVAASLYFYAHGNIAFLPLLAGTVVFNYFILKLLRKNRGRRVAPKLLLALAVLENLGLLFYFKYMNFFIKNVNYVFGTDYILYDIVLPIGISFYTFQILAHVIDTYRGESEDSTFLEFAVFVTFFPQLIVGPIVRHDYMMEQIRAEKVRRVDTSNIIKGIMLFSMGCAKKILIADPLISHAQHFYNVMGNGSFFEAWGAVLAYTFAYYFDFSGYIDMALGLGLFFNIKLPENFDSPYKARNFADFWRRWNITVSNFFYDYIFRRIFRFGDGVPKLVMATMVTFIVSGLWHGASWHFVFWGMANGILVCLANIMTLKRKKLPFPLAWALTFFLVLVTRVLFDANGMTQALNVYRTMFDIRPALSGFRDFLGSGLDYVGKNLYETVLIITGACICFFAPNTREFLTEYRPKLYHAVFAGALFAISLFFMGGVSNFLYFQF
ncbi:MAG: MBOAT family protein [Clostridiaceae bacterium]|jgi:alginate O-acetyltransferase complex protein AlgI|nr:MBOAT family protein [Clostridiaceae bacterium]